MFNLLAALLCRHPRPDTAQLSRRPFRPNPASHRLAQFEVDQKPTFAGLCSSGCSVHG
jgi:hypothetical protein